MKLLLVYFIILALYYCSFIPKNILKFFTKAKRKNGFITTRTEVFNVTHQQTGGYLLQWWELPHPIIEAALYHHTPFSTGIINQELIYAINIAQHYASIILKSQLTASFDPAVFHALGITQSQFEEEIAYLSVN